VFTLPARRALWIILGLLLAWAAAFAAPETTDLAEPDAVIAQANTLGGQNEYVGAIQLLQNAIERYPSYAPLAIALANWQELRGLAELPNATGTLEERRALLRQNPGAYPDLLNEVFETYGRAVMCAPTDTTLRKAIADETREDFPLMLGQYGALALPGDPTPFTYLLSDNRLPLESRGEMQGLITMRSFPVPKRYSKDPKYGAHPDTIQDPRYLYWSFSRMILAYDYDPLAKIWRLRFRVIWQDTPGQEEARLLLARQSAQLLLRLARVGQAYSGYAPRFSPDGVVNVWLANDGEAGGESYQENIYLQQVGTARSSNEWVRELAHEYGHQSIPVVGGYTKPEWASNGYLGECLYLRWLSKNLLGDQHPWLRDGGLEAYARDRVTPLVKAFVANGPLAKNLSGTDATAMNGFVGMGLYLDMTRGGRALAQALNAMTSPNFAGPDGFLASLEEQDAYFQSVDRPIIGLRVAELPAEGPIWVYLRSGKWRGLVQRDVDNSTKAPLKCQLRFDGKELKVSEQGIFNTSELERGWHTMRITPLGNEGPAADVKLLRL